MTVGDNQISESLGAGGDDMLLLSTSHTDSDQESKRDDFGEVVDQIKIWIDIK